MDVNLWLKYRDCQSGVLNFHLCILCKMYKKIKALKIWKSKNRRSQNVGWHCWEEEGVLFVSVGFRMLCVSYILVGLHCFSLHLISLLFRVFICRTGHVWHRIQLTHSERKESCFGKIALLVKASEVSGCRTWVVDKTVVQKRGKEE